MATIKDIADQAGVSTATVSYVMNDLPEVANETRDKVLQIAQRMNYVPRKKVRTRRPVVDQKPMSLVFVSCLPFDPWGESYYGQFLAGCLNMSHKTDSMLQVAKIDQSIRSKSDLPIVIRNRIADGLIVTGWPDSEVMEGIAELKIPVVLLDTKDVYDGFSHVRPDHGGGAVKSIQYLYGLGHRRIGVITGDLSFTCESERLAAYYMAMTQLGLDWKAEWIVKQSRFIEQAGSEGMEAILRKKLDVTAVVCHGDIVAKGAMKMARERGVSVPGQISIVGCDNQSWTDKFDPPLTTVDVSLTELGELAVRHLFDRIKNPELSPQRITVEARMVVRESAGPVPIKK